MEDNTVATGTQGKVLQAFSRDLNREAHILTEHPELLWQQLYNRLQWEGEGGDGFISRLIAAEFAYRSGVNGKHWFHRRNKIRESESLVRVIAGHTMPVWSCCFSPDGKLL